MANTGNFTASLCMSCSVGSLRRGHEGALRDCLVSAYLYRQDLEGIIRARLEEFRGNRHAPGRGLSHTCDVKPAGDSTRQR